jgi:hypothetical protein
VRRTVPPSAEIGVGDNPWETLSQFAKLGARLIIQRAVEDELGAWLGRARYERRPDHQRGMRNFGDGYRNGNRPCRVQTAEEELEVEIPQVREVAETLVSKRFPRTPKLLRTEPLKAVIEFFTASLRNLLAAERDAGVAHYVAVRLLPGKNSSFY